MSYEAERIDAVAALCAEAGVFLANPLADPMKDFDRRLVLALLEKWPGSIHATQAEHDVVCNVLNETRFFSRQFGHTVVMSPFGERWIWVCYELKVSHLAAACPEHLRRAS